jgi:hypothetical protein
MANLPEGTTEKPETPTREKPIVPNVPIMQTAIKTELDRFYGDRGWHCDHIWADRSMPPCVIVYLDVMRAPATEQIGKPRPALYATHEGKRVRVVMASRFGDVGITEDLSAEYGYSKRVFLPELTEFSDER